MIDQKTPTELLWFLIVSRAEAISFLLLLGIAMPLKYMMDMPLMVKYVGWAHGTLFMAYMVLLVLAAVELRWSLWKTFLAAVASFLPFGPFVFERKMIN